MFSREKFARRLVNVRNASNVSAPELANACGLSQPAISLLESGKRSPSVESLCLIADHLNVPVDYLIGDEVKRLPTNAGLQDKIALLPKEKQEFVEKLVDFLLYEDDAHPG